MPEPDASDLSAPVVLTRGGAPEGVVMDVDEYDRLVERAERADLDEAIRRGDEAIATGELLEWEDVKRAMLERIKAQ